MEITITRQHVVRALLAGACSVPRVGMPIRRLTSDQLDWAEDAGIVDAADREAVWADCRVEVLGGSLTGLPFAWRSSSGSGYGSGYGYGDVYGDGYGDGYGYESGYGYDYGYGEGYGDGYGNGYGDGSGYGYGDGYGYEHGDGYEDGAVDGSGYGSGEEQWRRIAEILTGSKQD